jgi:hypothetical protein
MSVFRVTVRVVLLPLVIASAAPAATDPVYKAMRESGIADSFIVENIDQSNVAPEFMMPVPIYLDLDGRIVRLGVIDMKGNSTNSALHELLPTKPLHVMVNYWHDILEL